MKESILFYSSIEGTCLINKIKEKNYRYIGIDFQFSDFLMIRLKQIT